MTIIARVLQVSMRLKLLSQPEGVECFNIYTTIATFTRCNVYTG